MIDKTEMQTWHKYITSIKLQICMLNNVASFFLNQTDFQVILSPLKIVNILFMLYLNGFNEINLVKILL